MGVCNTSDPIQGPAYGPASAGVVAAGLRACPTGADEDGGADCAEVGGLRCSRHAVLAPVKASKTAAIVARGNSGAWSKPGRQRYIGTLVSIY
jgi:hypothetical protein